MLGPLHKVLIQIMAKKLHFIIHLIFDIAGVDFIAATTNVPVLEEPVVTICATLDVIDDSLLEDNELLQIVVNAGGLEYLAIITILDTVDSECTASYSIPLPFCNMCTHYNITRVPFCLYYVSLQEYIIQLEIFVWRKNFSLFAPYSHG